MVMCGINTLFPLLTPLAISTSKTLSPSFDMISHVLFLSPFPEPAQRFLNKITGAPTLSAIECGDIPESVIEFRNSVGYACCMPSSATVSADKYVLPSPGYLSI